MKYIAEDYPAIAAALARLEAGYRQEAQIQPVCPTCLGEGWVQTIAPQAFDVCPACRNPNNYFCP